MPVCFHSMSIFSERQSKASLSRFGIPKLSYLVLVVCAWMGVANLTAQSKVGVADQGSAASAQQSAQADIPNAPAPQNSLNDQTPKQTKRILLIIPNFRAVNAGQKLPPQSVKDKFVTCTQDSFDYTSPVIPALLAGYSMATNATPEFGSGAAGYGRYFWHAALDQTQENYMVEFIVPVITHEDTRYYTLGSGGFLDRAGYALSRAVVTRSDSGKEVFNVSEVVGSGASAGLSTVYYPERQRSFSNTGKQWGVDIGIDSASFVVKEFWPDINHRLFRIKNPTDPPQH